MRLESDLRTLGFHRRNSSRMAAASRQSKRHGGPSKRWYSCLKKAGGCGRILHLSPQTALETYVVGLLLPLLDSPDVREAIAEHEGVTNEEAVALVTEKTQATARSKGMPTRSMPTRLTLALWAVAQSDSGNNDVSYLAVQVGDWMDRIPDLCKRKCHLVRERL